MRDSRAVVSSVLTRLTRSMSVATRSWARLSSRRDSLRVLFRAVFSRTAVSWERRWDLRLSRRWARELLSL